MTETTRYQRILLKLSGEALLGKLEYGVDPEVVAFVAEQVKAVTALGVQVGIVVGGGNIFRGMAAATATGMDRATADYMGMLATVMNALALADAMDKQGLIARVMSAINIEQVVEPYIRPKALQYLEEGKVVIFAAGTGNPFFTTDTGAALRAAEMNCDALFKGTSVDGIYDADPKQVPGARRYETVSYSKVLADNLKVMDASAVSMCRDNDIPIIVFNIREPGALLAVLNGEGISTTVTGDANG